jgi:hypothetical protein
MFDYSPPFNYLTALRAIKSNKPQVVFYRLPIKKQLITISGGNHRIAKFAGFQPVSAIYFFDEKATHKNNFQKFIFKTGWKITNTSFNGLGCF